MSLFDNYVLPSSGVDELLSAPGSIRPHGQAFVEAVERLGSEALSRRWERARRLVHENGISFSAYNDPEDRPRPWELDALPLLVDDAQWSSVCAGLEQRARLLNLLLRDLYGPRRLLEQGLIPPKLLYGHPGFMPSFHGQSPPNDCYLHFYAADLARAPDGDWYVLSDRTESPSGSGYALENRIVISRIFPRIFRDCHVHRLAPYFIALRETMNQLAPKQRDNPLIVLLSQGPRNANFFEDAYLARYLGYTLVEADDLTVRNAQVMLKTLGGLLRVDVILRRPNSEHCDPLEFQASSNHGVTGLLQAVREGHVTVANPLGSGLVESPVFAPFLPKLCTALLGEELKLPGVPTWWCGDEKSLDYVLRHLDRLFVKPAFRRRGSPQVLSVPGQDTSSLADMIRADPHNYVAQEAVARSTAPVWIHDAISVAHIALRAYLVGMGDSYTAMHGGLARVSSTSEPLERSLQSGERSKDVWVLSDQPVSSVSLLQPEGQPVSMRRSGAGLPSRVADNVYWLGRHIERVEASARLLRAIGLRLTSETETASIVELPMLIRALAAQGQIEPGYAVDPIRDQLPPIEGALPQMVFDENHVGSLRSILNAMFRIASQVRDRLSLDSWRIVHRLDQEFRPPSFANYELTDVLPILDSLIIDLSAFSGMVLESMTRTQVFRFLELGRRLERAMQTVNLLKNTLIEYVGTVSPVLESLLEIADSLMTYRSRYLANLQLAPVLDLLLTDETNPRSVAYQLASLQEQVDKLPRDQAETGYATEQRLIMSALHTIRMVDVRVLAELHRLGERNHLDKLLSTLQRQLPKLSDAISHRYLIHAGPVRQLSEIRPG